MSRAFVLSLMATGLALAALPAFDAGPPRLIWNASASVPQGLYWLGATTTLQVGELVAIEPPPALAAWLASRGALPAGVPLIKRVAALPPSEVCRAGERVTIDGAPAARAERMDGRGRGLPQWTGCRRLAAHEVFLLNRASGSLDSRYFGPLPQASVLGRLTPVWLVEVSAHAG